MSGGLEAFNRDPDVFKCGGCDHRHRETDGGWCYMFDKFMPDCQQFKEYVCQATANQQFQPIEKVAERG